MYQIYLTYFRDVVLVAKKTDNAAEIPEYENAEKFLTDYDLYLKKGRSLNYGDERKLSQKEAYIAEVLADAKSYNKINNDENDKVLVMDFLMDSKRS